MASAWPGGLSRARRSRASCSRARPFDPRSAASQFKDIGKACSDLLSKDFKTGKTTVEIESKTSSGITFTPLATKSGEKINGELKAKYGVSDGVEAECTITTAGGASLSLEAADLVTKGLVMTAECEHSGGALGSANFIAEYKSELFSSKCSFDYFKNSLLANISTGLIDGVTVGLDCAYCTNTSKLGSTALAAQFVQPEFIVGAKW
jgi:hypothetical protein